MIPRLLGPVVLGLALLPSCGHRSNGVIEDHRFQELNRNGLQISLDLFVPEVYNVRT